MVKLLEIETWTNKGNHKQKVSVSLTQSTTSLPSFVPKFKILSQVVTEMSVTDFFFSALYRSESWKKKKMETKAKIIITILIVRYTIHLATLLEHKESEEARSNGR